MRKNKLLLLIFCFIAVAQTVAQREPLNGAITNTTDVEGIHVMNLTSRYNTVTDAHGNFSIAVKQRDTLLFSSLNYAPKKMAISAEIIEKGIMVLTLEELVYELDEVYLGPRLSGNLQADLATIKTKKKLNFYDVGLPGFRGEPKEKIVPLWAAAFPTQVDLEALYKYTSGYYKTLKTKRKWEAQNNTVTSLIDFYGPGFFEEAYNIPKGRLYDFLLFCAESSDLQEHFKKENYILVLNIFKEKGMEYTQRLQQSKIAEKE
ncbi:hypothetical protein [Marixanthomonas spongiae]|uniref:Carboxypeptidase-like regulatory domain-containing protein n=1 Tax=Marixanthomonas spongiae TaxID=2174845 RepID=A0A2U0I7E4_9FLAO|nr:hypothetical protein [Marixanthomonas spongiae]PVW17021.1 hypothetical protein DDV96_00385 [Marixanthomonas spongiae]